MCVHNKIYVQESQKDFVFRELQKYSLFDIEKLLKGEEISAIQEMAIKKIGQSLQKIWEPIKELSDKEGMSY
jgi:hypothetical protein